MEDTGQYGMLHQSLLSGLGGGVSTCGASCNRVVGCKVISGGFLHLNLGLGFLI